MSKEQLEAEFRTEVRASILELRTDIKKLLSHRAWQLGVGAAISAIVSTTLLIIFGR